MKNDLLHTPEGVRDIYNGECARKTVLENRLRDVCALYGYNDIQTPTFEFFDVFNKERGSVPSNQMFKLFDRYGNTLVLRPDMTPAIARAAAKYFSEHVLPLKLCYAGNTFINNHKAYQGRLKENTMIGAELIGDSSVDADFEIISMVIDCMKNAGLHEFQVEVGNVRFFRGLLAQAGISGDDEEMLVSLIQNKNYFGVEELLDSLKIDRHIADVLLELPQLFGSVDVLDKARRLTDCADSLAAVDRLYELYELLKVTGSDRYITFDLGTLSKHTYYTGIVFHAYTFGTGEPVAQGGRYDRLIGQFGREKASIGFSVTVDRLMAAIGRQGIDIPLDVRGTLLVYPQNMLNKAVAAADRMRKTDVPVCMIASRPEKTKEQYLEYAANAQLEQAVFMQENTDAVTVLSARTGKERQMSLEDLLGGDHA